MDEVLWYYSDATLRQQQGPFTTFQMQALLAKGQINESALAWHEEMTSWQPIRTIDFRGKKAIQWLIPAILSQTDRKRPNSLTSEGSDIISKTKELLFPRLRRATTTETGKSTAEEWQQETSVEGQIYFLNTRTGEVAWDLPSEEVGDAEEWEWVPDVVEGYYPAHVVEHLHDGGQIVQRFEQEVPLRLTAKTAKQCLPLSKHELSRAVYVSARQDLVHIETLNEGSVLHVLKTRYSSDLIYTRIGSLLVVLNPCKPLPLYTESHISRVRNR